MIVFTNGFVCIYLSLLLNYAANVETIQDRIIGRFVNVEQLVEWELTAETVIRGQNLPQRHSVHHKSHMT
jgi:hypothetical protein